MTGRFLSAFGLVCLGTAMLACAAESQTQPRQQVGSVTEDPADDDQACVPGHQTICACPGGLDGTQVCQEDGSGLGTCECTPDTEEPTEGCGDAWCAPGENCHTCAAECGTCLPCEDAPSCENAQVPAADVPHYPEFDVPKMELLTTEQLQQRLANYVTEASPAMRVLAAALDDEEKYDEHPWVTELRAVFGQNPAAAQALRTQLGAVGMGTPAEYRVAHAAPTGNPYSEWTPLGGEFPGGTEECGAPMLRVGVSKIKVHEEDDDFANDIIYCVIQAEGKDGAEVRITPKTPNLDEGDEYQFALESGVFWGQGGPSTPGGNMLITYDCIEADTTDGYQNLVTAVGEAATNVGDVVEGDNGWIFSTAGAIAPVVATGLALDTDDHLFNAQQTIPLEKQLELTNGAFWTVRREGTHVFSDWDWELYVKAWGCAEYGTL